MTDFAVAVHEAGHCLAAWVLGMPILGASIRKTETRHGMSWLDGRKDSPDSPIDIAIVLVAGELAEQMSRDDDHVRFNWFAESHDAESARDMCDLEDDPLDVRHFVQLRARVLLRSRWRAVEALADQLARREVITGDMVEETCRKVGVRKDGETLGKPLDPETRLAPASIAGKAVNLREWAHALDLSAKDPRRARKLILSGKGKRR